MTPEDYAFTLFSETIPDGERVFAALSRYDDLLTMRGRNGYEPGDTLALLLPFITAHGLTWSELGQHAKSRARVMNGAAHMLQECCRASRPIHVVTTSYEQFAASVCELLEVDPQFLHSTALSEQQWAGVEVTGVTRSLVLEMEDRLKRRFYDKNLWSDKRDDDLVDILDTFFLHTLPAEGQAYPTTVVQPRGGRRKVLALQAIVRENERSPADLIFIGDSITDAAAFGYVDNAGGLAMAFNGNQFAIENATVAIASGDVAAVLPVIDAWELGGRSAVQDLLGSYGPSSEVDAAWLPGSDRLTVADTVARHGVVRARVRQAAAGLS